MGFERGMMDKEAELYMNDDEEKERKDTNQKRSCCIRSRKYWPGRLVH